MIELVIADRCIGCGACVDVCPTDVFDQTPSGAPLLTRPEDCQTCFMCELYCPADALFVGPDCETRIGTSVSEALASRSVGQYRRDSGWDEWAHDPRFTNQHWRMEGIFARARAIASS